MNDEIKNNENSQEKEQIKEIEKEEYNNINNKNNNQIDNKEEPLINEITKTKEKKRYFGIDLIRALACYLVLLTHSGETFYMGNGFVVFIRNDNNIWGGVINSLSRVCVPLFVMISGYLLLPMKTDYKTFLKKRFTRISFPFLVFCVLYDLFYYIKGDIDLKTMFINIPKILINYGTEVGHLWYMYMAMGIYLFIPIISPWIKTAKKEHFYYYFAIWFVSLFNVYIHYIYPEVWGEAYWNNTSLFQSFIGNFGYAVLGAFIKIHLKEYNLYITGIILYIVGAGLTMLGFIYKREKAKDCKEVEMTLHFNTINVAMSTFGIFLLLRKIEIKNKYICNIVNDIALKSFGIYLVHIFFLTLFRYLLDAVNQHPSWCILVLSFLTFISSYLTVKIISFIPYSEYIIG